MKLHELFADESKWCKGAMARDAKGFGTYHFVDQTHPEVGHAPLGDDTTGGLSWEYTLLQVNHKDACCYCLLGGIVKLYPKDEVGVIIKRISDWLVEKNLSTGVCNSVARVMGFGDGQPLSKIVSMLKELDI
jgi:hypothetical protein